MVEYLGSVHAVNRLLTEVEELLKRPSLGFELGKRKINTSIALLAVQGIIAYMSGDERRACDDLETAVDEIKARRDRR
jgi:hypothetical protein